VAGYGCDVAGGDSVTEAVTRAGGHVRGGADG
jgi:hypothetical protein